LMEKVQLVTQYAMIDVVHSTLRLTRAIDGGL
jgi:hypothetical protein